MKQQALLLTVRFIRDHMILHDDIKQIDDPILRKKSQELDLNAPNEINDIINKMRSTLDVVHTRYNFTWSSGISAVQIGILKRICLTWLPDEGFKAFINPIILSSSNDTNIKYEGCLSFFDKRGKVPRPNWIEVEYYNDSLEKKVERFDENKARILSHEIDHMDGILYIDRMQDSDGLIDIETYKQMKKEGKIQ